MGSLTSLNPTGLHGLLRGQLHRTMLVYHSCSEGCVRSSVEVRTGRCALPHVITSNQKKPHSLLRLTAQLPPVSSPGDRSPPAPPYKTPVPKASSSILVWPIASSDSFLLSSASQCVRSVFTKSRYVEPVCNASLNSLNINSARSATFYVLQLYRSRSRSYFTADCQSPPWDLRPDITSCRNVTV
jgi:hypothetical protein